MTGLTWIREPLPKIKASATASKLTQTKEATATAANAHNSAGERVFSGLAVSSADAAKGAP
jgi:hypothetical protein